MGSPNLNPSVFIVIQTLEFANCVGGTDASFQTSQGFTHIQRDVIHTFIPLNTIAYPNSRRSRVPKSARTKVFFETPFEP